MMTSASVARIRIAREGVRDFFIGPRLAPRAVSISWRAHQLLRLGLGHDFTKHLSAQLLRPCGSAISCRRFPCRARAPPSPARRSPSPPPARPPGARRAGAAATVHTPKAASRSSCATPHLVFKCRPAGQQRAGQLPINDGISLPTRSPGEDAPSPDCRRC
jgi:hypothetical protein